MQKRHKTWIYFIFDDDRYCIVFRLVFIHLFHLAVRVSEGARAIQFHPDCVLDSIDMVWNEFHSMRNILTRLCNCGCFRHIKFFFHIFPNTQCFRLWSIFGPWNWTESKAKCEWKKTIDFVKIQVWSCHSSFCQSHHSQRAHHVSVSSGVLWQRYGEAIRCAIMLHYSSSSPSSSSSNTATTNILVIIPMNPWNSYFPFDSIR